jgi:hypothetical protein
VARHAAAGSCLPAVALVSESRKRTTRRSRYGEAKFVDGDAQSPKRLAVDLHYDDGTVRRGVVTGGGVEVGEQLEEGKWVVEQVVPSPGPRIDLEVYVRRIRPDEVPPPILNYLVIKVSGDAPPTHTSLRAVGLLAPGDIVWLGIERCRVIRMKSRGGLALLDGVLVVEPAPRSRE